MKKHKFKRWPLLIKIGAIVAGSLLLLCGLVYLFGRSFYLKHHDEPFSLGVSFSQQYAQELGLNWQAAYTAILDELPVKRLRLMSYWDALEPAPDKYNFNDLDWQFRQAARHHIKITLVVGLRQPRWPECHQPAWAAQLSQAQWQERLMSYLNHIVNHYRHQKNLESWQLENEALNHFGICPRYDRNRLKNEYRTLKQLDTNHPIIMSTSDGNGLPLRQPVPDVYGFSLYRIFYNVVGYHGYLMYPAPVWYQRFRAFLTEAIHHRPIIIHELQMEPWGPQPTRDLSIAEQDKSMDTLKMRKNFNIALATGIRKIDLWGAEWWYWRKVHFHDSRPWDTAKAILNQ